MSTQPLSTPQDWALHYNPSLDPNAVGIEQPIVGARPNQLPFGTSLPSAGDLSGWLGDQNPLSQGLKNLFGDGTPGAVGNAVGKVFTFGGASFGVIDVVAIVAGLILLGAALFGLDTVRETTINVAKKGAEVAAA